jgi:hypothetical protein
LNATQWKTVAAMCNQILPTLDGSGANEANCVNFIDKALAHEEKNRWRCINAVCKSRCLCANALAKIVCHVE